MIHGWRYMINRSSMNNLQITMKNMQRYAPEFFPTWFNFLTRVRCCDFVFTTNIIKASLVVKKKYFCLLSANLKWRRLLPDWSPRDHQRWIALFQRFGVFQGWFRGHEKYQRWSALFQRWWALIFSESALFRTEEFSAVSERISAVQRCFCWLWNIEFSALNSANSTLIYSELALISKHADGNIKLW